MSKYFSLQNPHILQKVRFSTHFLLHKRLANHVGKCVDLAACGGIRELDLYFWHYEHYGNPYCTCTTLPSIFFQSPLLVTVLKLEGCHVRDSNFAGFPVLKILTLAYLHIGDQAVLDMVSACPSLENLVLECCLQLKNVNLSSKTMHRLVIKHCTGVKSVLMDLPSLRAFEYDNSVQGKKTEPWKLSQITEFRTTKGVKLASVEVLCLAFMKMNPETLKHIFAIFPNLVDLRMKGCLVNYESQTFPETVKKLYVVDVHIPELIEGFASSVEALHCDSTTKCLGFTSYTAAGRVSFVCLKSVTLAGFFVLSNDALNRLISSCPILEILNLRDCVCIKQLSISSQVLKVLTVKARSNYLESVEIETPNLVSFEYDGPLIVFFQLVFSPALVCVLRFKQCLGYIDDSLLLTSKEIIGKFKKASSLTVSGQDYEWVFSNESNCTLPCWSSWGQLKMKSREIYMFRQARNQIPNLLFVSQCCTTLSIKLCSLTIQLEFADPAETDNISLHLGKVHDCLRDHLVKATIKNFEGGSHEFDLLKFLLRKAHHLKAMFITLKSRAVTENPLVANGFRDLANIPTTARIMVASN
ncbi:hypothetical protein RND81_11G180000 [Saponaria officinalis]